MADRALRPESSEREVFDLDKDERWQARLAEARARREVALREKASSGAEPKRRLKPWEEAGQADAYDRVEPMLPAELEDKLDFSDRVKSLRHTIEQYGDNGGPVTDEPENFPVGPTKSEKRTSVAERYISELSPEFVPAKPFVPGDDDEIRQGAGSTVRISDPGRKSRDLAKKNAATMEPDRPEWVVEPEPVALPPKTMTRHKSRRRGVPALLLAGICLLAVMPFATTVAPIVTGPVQRAASPLFGFQPALGVTSPMNAMPRATVSGEWAPLSLRAPVGPLSVALEPAARQQREIAPLPFVEIGSDGFGVLGWSTVSPTSLAGGLPSLTSPRADRLPGEPEALPTADEVGAKLPLPEPLSLLRVTILMPENADASVADMVSRDLQERGHELLAAKTVNLTISQRNIRFFNEVDRGEAERLAKAYDARLKDFTSFRPRPNAGTVEIWLAGRSTAAAPAPRTLPEETPDVLAPTPRVIVVQRSPSLLVRLIDAIGGHDAASEPETTSDDDSDGSFLLAPVPEGDSQPTGDTGTDSSEVDAGGSAGDPDTGGATESNDTETSADGTGSNSGL